jgi:hypothetical protein
VFGTAPKWRLFPAIMDKRDSVLFNDRKKTMTQEEPSVEYLLPPQASRHVFKIIKNLDRASKGVPDSHGGLNAGTSAALRSQSMGIDLSAAAAPAQAAPIDRFAYLSICQSQGMAAARAAFQPIKVMKTAPESPFPFL